MSLTAEKRVRFYKYCAFIYIALMLIGSGFLYSQSITSIKLKKVIKTIEPLHQKLAKPKPGDWLTEHKESGQTFAQYIRSRPVTPRGKRNIIYVQTIGTFTKKHKEIAELTKEYMAIHFGTEVKELSPMSLSKIPASARRVHPSWGNKQILSTYILDKVLKPSLPKDAAALIALTSSDLWPGKNWNFVFGQASIRERVGVWSLYRNGDPKKSEESYKLCLRRTIKTAIHETGHMFSMYHCTAYECCMCGSNHREESDRRPLYFCPECMAKVCWAARIDPVKRYRKLRDFCYKHGLVQEQKFFEKSILKLKELK